MFQLKWSSSGVQNDGVQQYFVSSIGRIHRTCLAYKNCSQSRIKHDVYSIHGGGVHNNDMYMGPGSSLMGTMTVVDESSSSLSSS